MPSVKTIFCANSIRFSARLKFANAVNMTREANNGQAVNPAASFKIILFGLIEYFD